MQPPTDNNPNLVTIDVTTGDLVHLQQATSDDHLISMWLEKSDSPCTHKAYERAIRRFRQWLLSQGVYRLDRATAMHFLDYQRGFPSHWSDATRNQHKAAIKSLWTYGSELKYLPFNVPHAVYKLKKPKPVTAERVLTETEMVLMLRREKNPVAKLFVRFLYGTGVRVSEALAVQWRDFHCRGDRVFLSIQHGKGDQFREIGCQFSLYQDLLAARPAEALDEDEVFPVAYITAWRWVKTAMRRGGKPAGSPHWCRHAHAVVSHENGAGWHAIAQQLGHKRASFTMDRYGHFTGTPSTDHVQV